MKKLWANLTKLSIIPIIWLFTIIGVGSWSISHLQFAPSFPYYEDLSNFYSRELASTSHFDGIHYLRIIYKGYDDTGSQAFFPLYPLLISMLTFNYFDPLKVALVLNTLLLVSTLYLTRLTLRSSHFTKFLLLFLSFPTSFYLLSNYTESLFIFLVALFFYLASRKQFLLAAITAGLASSTRVVGVFLSLALLTYLIQNYRQFKANLDKYYFIYSTLLLFISILGLLSYSTYLYFKFGDPLMFVHVMSMFGVGRSTGEIILLPQLLYRYFKILITSPLNSIIGLRAIWELLTLVGVSVGLYLSRRKIAIPAMVFSLAVLIFPTLSGTLSSFPRYALVALPVFIGLSDVLKGRAVVIISLMQYTILIVAVALFVQGIFVA